MYAIRLNDGSLVGQRFASPQVAMLYGLLSSFDDGWEIIKIVLTTRI